MYSTTTFMRWIDLRLAVTASAVLAVSLLVLVTINSTAPPPPPGGELASGGQMLGTQTISAHELARRVKAGEIGSIAVIGDHGVATTVDNHPFTFSVVRGASALQQLQILGFTPEELRQVAYLTSQPPLEGAPFELLLVAVPLVLLGAAVLHVWRSSAPAVASQSQALDRGEEALAVIRQAARDTHMRRQTEGRAIADDQSMRQQRLAE